MAQEGKEAFVMKRYGNAVITRWEGESSLAIHLKFMDQLEMEWQANGCKPMALVGVFGGTFSPPDSELQNRLLRDKDHFVSMAGSIHFVFEKPRDGISAKIGFRIARLMSWSVNAFMGMRTSINESVTEALNHSKVKLDLPVSQIVARARADGLIQATRGFDAKL